MRELSSTQAWIICPWCILFTWRQQQILYLLEVILQLSSLLQRFMLFALGCSMQVQSCIQLNRYELLQSP